MTAEITVSEKIAARNKSATYLLPLLGKYIDLSFSDYLVDTYVNVEQEMFEIAYPFGIVYDVTDVAGKQEFEDYIQNLIENEHSVYCWQMYTPKARSLSLYVFNFPTEFIPEYRMFKEGKYSQFSKKAKDVILAYSISEYKYHPLTQDIAGILWKKKERRDKLEKMLGMSIPEDLELSSIMDKEKETFNIKINE